MYRGALDPESVEPGVPLLYHQHGVVSRSFQKNVETIPTQIIYPDKSSTIGFPSGPFSKTTTSELNVAANEQSPSVSNNSIIAFTSPSNDEEVKGKLFFSSIIIAVCASIQLILLVVFAEREDLTLFQKVNFSLLIFVDLLYVSGILLGYPILVYLERILLFFGIFFGLFMSVRSIWNLLFFIIASFKVYGLSKFLYYTKYDVFVVFPQL